MIALGRADGAYVGLPTMVTADAAFDRKFSVDNSIAFGTQLFEQPPQVVLAHSKRHRHPTFRFAPTRSGMEEEKGMAPDWFGRSSRRALLTELGVGTVDQALAGALRARHATMRLAGLWRKVLLVDEVHAYDDYMQALLQALMRWQGMMGDPVVLMSATLPSRMRAALIRAYADGAGWTAVADMAEQTRPGAYPLLTLVSGQGIAQHPLAAMPGPGTRPVRFEAAHTREAVEERIAQWLQAGRSVIWFRNTVDDAVESWERLRAFDPLLYHARFLPADRAAREAELRAVLGKGAGAQTRRSRLVIATQAAEQSLDLDADEMVSDLAPADSLVQRLGRRRHARDADGVLAEDGVDRRPDSPVLLFTPPLEPAGTGWYAATFPRAGKIYSNDAQLWLSARYLLRPQDIPNRADGGDDSLILVRDLRPLLEAVYAETPDGVPSALLARHAAAEGDSAAERLQGLRARLPFRNGLLEDWSSDGEVKDAQDKDPTTRLIDSHAVILAVIEDGQPRLLGAVQGEAYPVEASECRCPKPLASIGEQNTAWRDRILAALSPQQARMLDPDRLVFLTERTEEGWSGRACLTCSNNSQKTGAQVWAVSYNTATGLTLGRAS